MASKSTQTDTREKYAVYLEQAELDRLREYQKEVGVPVSESIRRAVSAYVATLPTQKALAKLFK
jgi:Ribbon-helix-helix domain